MLRFIAVFCGVALLASLLLVFPASADISVSADSAILYEPTEGLILYEKNADKRRPMASTTKVMTALVAVENYTLDTVVEFPSEAVGTPGSSAYFKAGEKMTVEDLLYALLLQSANDAAVALAILVAGDIPSFAEQMNQKAEALGLCDTHFQNPHGLHEDGHYTTAKELAIIAAEALRHPILRPIFSAKRYTAKTSCADRTFVNHNKLLFQCAEAVGMKTGFTKASGRCLVGAAEQDGLTLITVTLDAPNDWQDHRSLFSLGFSRYERVEVIAPRAVNYRIPVLGGSAPFVTLSNKDGFSCVLPRGERDGISVTPDISAYPIAPITSGLPCGRLLIRRANTVIATVPLYATSDIPQHP